MARGTAKNGFHIDDIVSTKPVPDVLIKTPPKTHELPATLIDQRPQRRVQKLIYLTVSQKRMLSKYGKRIGKTNGGASRIVEDALEEYFANHPLEK